LQGLPLIEHIHQCGNGCDLWVIRYFFVISAIFLACLTDTKINVRIRRAMNYQTLLIRYVVLATVITSFSHFGINNSFATEKVRTADLHAHHQVKNKSRQNYTSSVHVYSMLDEELLDSHGVKRSLKKVIESGKPVLLNFIFTTCPSLCPILSATFSQFQKKIKDDVTQPLLISISIDPEHDTPEKLAAYAKKFKAKDNWIFLTGNFGGITAIEKSFDAYRGEKMNHVPLTFLHKPGQADWVRIEGFTSAKDLLAEYYQLISE